MAEDSSTVFSSSDVVYRIPSVFYKSGTLLAFAEERSTEDDNSAKNLVMRRGVLKDVSTDKRVVEWSALQTVKEAGMDGYRTMNPCPLYDKSSSTLFLFFICVKGNVTEWSQIENSKNETRLCYVTSKDLGETWSQATDLTDRMPDITGWSTFAVGPGHGLQTSGGRLIVPVYAYAKGETTSHARSLYSDDSGSEWKFGQAIDQKSVECEMAEFFDDEATSIIYCNARGVKGHRVEAVSRDSGECFKKVRHSTLVETGTGCQGSVVSFPAQNEEASPGADPANKWLLYTHPKNKHKRINLAVYLNENPSRSNKWSKPWVINHGPSGYSDLAYVDDGWFVCLMECGKKSEIEKIACQVFSYKEVQQGIGKTFG